MAGPVTTDYRFRQTPLLWFHGAGAGFSVEREAPSEKRIRKADAETDADAEGRKEGRKQTLPSMSL